MKKIIITLLLSFWLSHSQDLDLKFDDVVVTSNDTAKVRLRALNFTDITSLQFAIKWDDTVADIIGVDNFGSDDISIGNFNLNRGGGEALFVWFNQAGEGTSILNGETIFELTFIIKKQGSTPIVIDNEPIVMEASRNFTKIHIGNYSGSINAINAAKHSVTFAPYLSKVSSDKFILPITVKDFVDISSFQFSLFFNRDQIELTGGESFTLDLDSNNVSVSEDGVLVTWFNDLGETTTLNDNDTIAKFFFDVKPEFAGTIPLTAIVDFGFQNEVSQNFEVVNFVQRHDGLIFDLIGPQMDGELIYSSIPGLEAYLTLYLYFDETLIDTPSVNGIEGQNQISFSETVNPFIPDNNSYSLTHTIAEFGNIYFYVHSEDIYGNASLDTVFINVNQNKAGESKTFEILDNVKITSNSESFTKTSLIYTTVKRNISYDKSLLSEIFKIETSSDIQSTLKLQFESTKSATIYKYDETKLVWNPIPTSKLNGVLSSDINENGIFALFENELSDKNPTSFVLKQNYPNPFNPVTQITFNLPSQGEVVLNIYNIAGKKVKTLLRETLNAGEKNISWNGTNQNGTRVSSGVYFYVLEYNGNRYSKKMILMK